MPVPGKLVEITAKNNFSRYTGDKRRNLLYEGDSICVFQSEIMFPSGVFLMQAGNKRNLSRCGLPGFSAGK